MNDIPQEVNLRWYDTKLGHWRSDISTFIEGKGEGEDGECQSVQSSPPLVKSLVLVWYKNVDIQFGVWVCLVRARRIIYRFGKAEGSAGSEKDISHGNMGRWNMRIIRSTWVPLLFYHYSSITPQVTVHGNRTTPNAPNFLLFSLSPEKKFR